ncbi:MAG: excinuclease ABC subunit UvrC [Bacilli bacterium]|nr:excinuclease ABC subunit UvrC [Bacilli bacterium]
MESKFKEKLSLVPHKPGSYQMIDKNGVIIYVGKAKDLHKRVSSYFNRIHTGKTAKMVSLIDDFKYVVASSEIEAFIIEINLIKKFKPKYNIMMMDDKSYPYIEYISSPYPRLKVSRYLNIRKKDGKKLFGPYPNAYAARRIVNLINRLYPLKKCEGMPKDLCLYYHIGECLGYCKKDINQDKIKEMEEEILSFLRGNDDILRNKILSKINQYSEALNFEMAMDLKNELEYIDIVLAKQKVELHDFVNRDVISYYIDNGYLSIEILFIRNGKLLNHKNSIFPINIDPEDDVEYYIADFYSHNEVPKEILIPDTLNVDNIRKVVETNIVVPQKGIKKDLLKMAYDNAKMNLNNKMEELQSNELRTTKSNEELASILNMDSIYRIDVFDNSNLFGSFAVSGMVVFIDGKPAKNEYRKYKVSVDVNDDYNTMKEIIYRRYHRALEENQVLPDLIIVDGGENQIRAALDVLSDLKCNIRVVGLKKNDKHRTNDLIDSDLKTIELDRMSNVFHYLTRMQDEVHRFTITYHRTLRSKGSISSILDDIDGIGSKRKKELIKKFGSVKNMMSASVEELEEIIPNNVAIELKKYLDEKYNSKNDEEDV